MLLDAQATSTSSSYLFTDLHCAEEDDAAFFVMPCVEGNPMTMWRSDTNTHTHTHTHTHVHAHTFSVMMNRAEWCCFFFLCFLFFPYAYEHLFCHLPFISSFHYVAPRHKHTIAQTNKQTQTHTAITFARASLHWDLCPGHWCAIISAPPLNVYGGALVYHFYEQHSFLLSFPLGSLLGPFSLRSISFSQVNPPGYYQLLQHMQRHIVLVSSNL